MKRIGYLVLWTAALLLTDLGVATAQTEPAPPMQNMPQGRMMGPGSGMPMMGGPGRMGMMGMADHVEGRIAFLMQFAKNGKRLEAWWAYESLIPLPDPDREASVLYDNNLLEPDERAELIERWREHFDKAQAPGFSYCVGQHPTRPEALWLSGRKAREAHYRWADIPASLVARWRRSGGKAAGAELVGESSQNYEAPE